LNRGECVLELLRRRHTDQTRMVGPPRILEFALVVAPCRTPTLGRHHLHTFDVAGGYRFVALKSRNNWPRSSGAFVGIFDLSVLFGSGNAAWPEMKKAAN
jgi:hypothetical protein